MILSASASLFGSGRKIIGHWKGVFGWWDSASASLFGSGRKIIGHWKGVFGWWDLLYESLAC